MIRTFHINAVVAIILVLLFLTSCLRDEGAVEIPTVPDHTQPTGSVLESVQTDGETSLESDEQSYQVSEAEKMWLDIHSDACAVILTEDEIKEENLRLLAESEKLLDVTDFKQTVKGEAISAAIGGYGEHPPHGYDKDGTAIDDTHRSHVSDNRALDEIAAEVSVRRAIITSRANLRSFPDHKPYYRDPKDPYDSIQQTELHLGAPVWVLHSSRDGEYLFVSAYHYSGWVKESCVSVTDDDALWNSFASPESFVTVLEPSITVMGEVADMGVCFPLVASKDGVHTVTVPVRDSQGILTTAEADIPSSSVCVGRLPYTYENFIRQAFRYEGVMYSWGGLDEGVDCSGYISNVMRTFGFMLPRDTKHQESVVGTAQDVRGKSHEEKAALLDEVKAPTAVYYPGHVLFYLGYVEDEGKYYFIHAPRIGEAVSVTTKTDLSGMTYICEFKAKQN